MVLPAARWRKPPSTPSEAACETDGTGGPPPGRLGAEEKAAGALRPASDDAEGRGSLNGVPTQIINHFGFF